MAISVSLVSAPLEPLAGAAVAATPDAAATKLFASLLQVPAVDTPATVPAVTGPVTPGITGPATAGDRILNGMQNVSNEFRDTWTRVSDTLRADRPEMGMQEMLSLQLHLTQASVQYDLLGKAVSRSTQNFDQLVRVQ